MSNGGGMGRSGGAVYRWACALALATAGVAGVTVAVVAEDTAAPEAKVTTATATTQRHQRQGGHVDGAASRPWRGGRDEAGSRVARRGTEGPTEEEWREVVGFMARYSPNRLKAIEKQSAADGPRFAGLRRFVWSHYKDLIALKEKGDQELYDLRVRMTQAEDEAFGLQRQMREASESDRPVVRHELRQKLTEMVRLGLKEREMRIARLEKALGAEKAKLAADEQSVDDRVQERLQAMSKGMRKREDGRGAATTAVGSEVK